MIQINLDTVKKWRNSKEWRPIHRASFHEMERFGDAPIAPLCRDLIEAGHDPADLVVIVRGSTRCFEPAPLGEWAAGKVGRGEQPEQLKRVGQ